MASLCSLDTLAVVLDVVSERLGVWLDLHSDQLLSSGFFLNLIVYCIIAYNLYKSNIKVIIIIMIIICCQGGAERCGTFQTYLVAII